MNSNCTHDKVKKVWEIGKNKGLVLAGNRHQMEEQLGKDYFPDLVLNLCGTRIKPPFTMDTQARELFGEAYPVLRNGDFPVIDIDWPDMGVPKVGAKFWEELARWIKTGKTVALYCVGGHGRTGTALTAIAHAAGWNKDKGADIIAVLRKLYCGAAVETDSQIEYLKSLGVQTSSKAGHSSSVVWSGISPKGTGSTSVSIASKTHTLTQSTLPTAGPGKKNIPGTCKPMSQTQAWNYHQIETSDPRRKCLYCGQELDLEEATNSHGDKIVLIPAPKNPNLWSAGLKKIEGQCGQFKHHLVERGKKQCRDCGTYFTLEELELAEEEAAN